MHCHGCLLFKGGFIFSLCLWCSPIGDLSHMYPLLLCLSVIIIPYLQAILCLLCIVIDFVFILFIVL